MTDEHVEAVIQARLGSKRFPKKVLAKLAGEPMLKHIVRRVWKSELLWYTTLAVPESDEAILKQFAGNGTSIFPGSEVDVLDRVYDAMDCGEPDVVVRITGDCPLVDPNLIDHAITYRRLGQFDFVTTTFTYGDGFDVEVFTMDALRRTWEEATDPYDREHVTSFMITENGRFKVGRVPVPPQWISLVNPISRHLSVDIPDDLKIIRHLYKKLGPDCGVFDVLKELNNERS